MKKYILIILVLSAISSCKNKKVIPKEEVPAKKEVVEIKKETTGTPSKKGDYNTKMAEVAKGLIGKYWKLVEVNGVAVEMTEGMKEPHLKFLPEFGINGNGGCNSFFGVYSLENSRFITFSGVGMTEMACSFKNYDQSFSEIFSIPTEFTLVGEDKLIFHIGKRMAHAKFEAIYF
jgi:heat shock protein HslJ